MPKKQQTDLFQKAASSLHSDGSRNYVHPADVKGHFTSRRNVLFAIFIGLYVAMPWIQIGGHPAVFLDIPARRFFLFGLSFNAQDTWLLFFLLSGVGFALFVITAVFGRLWCGYSCPQTVFLEGMFRKVERIIEGPRNVRIRRNKGPATFDKIWRKTLKHFLFIFMSSFIAHVFLSYFVSLPKLFEMVKESPLDHMTSFLWVISLTGIMYFNFAWFREQMCLIICPYGRLQSVMTDKDTIIIGYDDARGEPRGKKKKESNGSCVDCGRCTAVCPTGIDIRNGLQMDCIGCAACVDACDEIMVKLKRPKGLIRYDSLSGLRGEKKTFWRPRLGLYAFLAILGLTVAIFSVSSRSDFEANLLRLGGNPYIQEADGRIQNLFEIHVVNKSDKTRTFEVHPSPNDAFEYVIAIPTVELKGGEGRRIPIFIYSPNESNEDRIELEVHPKGAIEKDEKKLVQASFLRPRK